MKKLLNEAKNRLLKFIPDWPKYDIGNRIYDFIEANNQHFRKLKSNSFAFLNQMILFIGLFLFFAFLLSFSELYFTVTNKSLVIQQKEKAATYMDFYEKDWKEELKKIDSANFKTPLDPATIYQYKDKLFSPRFLDHRYLIYHRWFSNDTKKDSPPIDSYSWLASLADWQNKCFKELANKDDFVSNSRRFFLLNPGFYWDIIFHLPLIFTTLTLCIWYLFLHLYFSSKPKEKGLRPFIGKNVLLSFYNLIFHPYVLGVHLLAALFLTAGNFGYSGNPNSKVFHTFSILAHLCFIAIVPYLVIFRKGYLLTKNLGNEKNQQANIVLEKWLKFLFFMALLLLIITTIVSLNIEGVFDEKISQLTLAWVKVPQRFLRYFLISFGIFICVFAIQLLVVLGKQFSVSTPEKESKLSDEMAKWDNLFKIEIGLLDYFALYSVILIFSFAQSAIPIKNTSSVDFFNLGLAISMGIIIVTLILLIPPISYIAYLIFDLRRFDNWVKTKREQETTSDADKTTLELEVGNRAIHNIKYIFWRKEFILPMFVLFIVCNIAYQKYGGVSFDLWNFFPKLFK